MIFGSFRTSFLQIDNGGDKASSKVSDNSSSFDLTLVSNLPKETLESLATCHSLGHMTASSSNYSCSESGGAGSSSRSANQGGKDTSAFLIGDPLEKATFTAIQYTLSKSKLAFRLVWNSINSQNKLQCVE